MSATYGRTSPPLPPPYGQRSWSSKTWTDTGLWALTLSSATSPTSGSMRSGVLYELPTLAPRTAARESSSSRSLPTPTWADGRKMSSNPETSARRRARSQNSLTDTVQTVLLPTPVADNSRGLAQPGTDYQSLPNVAIALLPTPTAQAAKHGETPDTGANAFGHNLWDLPSLLPTPKAGDGERGRDLPRLRPDTAARELATVAGQIGASTPPPSTDGNASPGDPHPLLPFPE